MFQPPIPQAGPQKVHWLMSLYLSVDSRSQISLAANERPWVLKGYTHTCYGLELQSPLVQKTAFESPLSLDLLLLQQKVSLFLQPKATWDSLLYTHRIYTQYHLQQALEGMHTCIMQQLISWEGKHSFKSSTHLHWHVEFHIGTSKWLRVECP